METSVSACQLTLQCQHSPTPADCILLFVGSVRCVEETDFGVCLSTHASQPARLLSESLLQDLRLEDVIGKFDFGVCLPTHASQPARLLS